MPLYLLVPLLGLCAILQSTVVPQIPVVEARPDLPLLVVIAWGAISETRDALRWGVIGGLWLDILSGLPFGVQTISLASIGFITDLLETSFFRSSILAPIVTTFIASLIYHSVALMILQLAGYTVEWNPFISKILLPSAIVNTLAMPFVYGMMHWLFRQDTVELRV